ncbi:hypothetical protein [Heyndrickxia camelliae]|nr:hypothetical protein [Heyndrickxia camelliae]
MKVYDVMDELIFNADLRHLDKRLSEMITVELATRIQEEQQY